MVTLTDWLLKLSKQSCNYFNLLLDVPREELTEDDMNDIRTHKEKLLNIISDFESSKTQLNDNNNKISTSV